jgi:hypothetical protein
MVSPVAGPLLTILGDRAMRTFAGHRALQRLTLHARLAFLFIAGPLPGASTSRYGPARALRPRA